MLVTTQWQLKRATHLTSLVWGCVVYSISQEICTRFCLLCFVVVIHWLILPHSSGLLHWHCGNLTIAPVPAKQPWWIWINTSCEFIMNDCITTTKQSTTKPCAYFLGYTVQAWKLNGALCDMRLCRYLTLVVQMWRSRPNIYQLLSTYEMVAQISNTCLQAVKQSPNDPFK